MTKNDCAHIIGLLDGKPKVLVSIDALMKVSIYRELECRLDKNVSSDLTRFKFCPMCGKKINWEQLKKQKL